ncbi:hypothetical protein GCM10023172_04540 [Hymenobacter ginsengisoli]|uniref:Uncharacterized protein n=2 Tax=Hymenobacteraceae TaxID=1853232 RepID=A0ABP8PY30_9BACT|nr:hypothetical protein [Hymenobacter sp. BT559]
MRKVYYCTQDPTDWTSDATWNEQELSLSGQVKWHFKLTLAAPCPCQVYAQLVTKRYTETDIYVADLGVGDRL